MKSLWVLLDKVFVLSVGAWLAIFSLEILIMIVKQALYPESTPNYSEFGDYCFDSFVGTRSKVFMKLVFGPTFMVKLVVYFSVTAD